MAETEPVIGLKEFIDSCTDIHEDTLFNFENVGDVCLTTITRANRELLHRAMELGYKGIIVSCPDFERESLAMAFLGALCHLICDEGDVGICEATKGMRAAIGDCVLDIVSEDDEIVCVRTASTKVDTGFLRSIWQFPWVHRAKEGSELSRMKSSELRAESERYENLPGGIRLILDIVGKQVPAVGYVSSPSPYLNEPPTRVLRGSIDVEGDEAPLSRTIPLTYFMSTGGRREGFEWPFDAPPSVLVGPRVDGMGSAYPLAEYVREGGRLDFVSMNLPGPEFMDTPLLNDLYDLNDVGVGVACFCDRWTLDAVSNLRQEGFLLFDWDDCELATRAEYPILSRVQWTMRERKHETVVEVPAGTSGIEEAKCILYDCLDGAELRTDEAWHAKQELFRALSAAIRMTESADKEYSVRMHALISDAVAAIGDSWSLSRESFDALCRARDLLLEIYKPGNVMPKETTVRGLIETKLASNNPTVLVVDRSRTEWVYDYWRKELQKDEIETSKKSLYMQYY